MEQRHLRSLVDYSKNRHHRVSCARTPKIADTGEVAAPMAVAIPGLSNEQCEMLLGIKKGSLLEIAIFTRPSLRSKHEESDEEAEGSEKGDDESESAEGSQDGEHDASEPANETGPTTLDATDSANVEIKDPLAPVSNVTRAADMAYLDDALAGGNQDLGVTSSAVNTGSGDADDGGVALNTTGIAAAPNLTAVANGQAADNVTKGTTSEDDQLDEESDGDQGENKDEDQYEHPHELWRKLFVVLDVETEEDDEGRTRVTDVQLRELFYQNCGEETAHNTYRIYGDTVSLGDQTTTPVDDEEPWSVADTLTSQPENQLTLTMDPTGSSLRRNIFGYACPGRCNRGWLSGRSALRELVDEQLAHVHPYKPLCPVCLGKDLMLEQHVLRALLDAMHIVDIGMVVEYLGRLNPARRALGYSFTQFDEREWGYAFDDMQDEDDYSDGGNDAGQYEQWDEAMDPNANPKTRPAPKTTLEALPRKTFAEVVRKEEGAGCAICQDGAFEAESKVVELPCGHVYDEGCLKAWISQYDNCPECRATVSSMMSEDKETDATDWVWDTVQQTNGVAGENAVLPSATRATDAQPEETAAALIDGDGDAIMSDAD